MRIYLEIKYNYILSTVRTDKLDAIDEKKRVTRVGTNRFMLVDGLLAAESTRLARPEYSLYRVFAYYIYKI